MRKRFLSIVLSFLLTNSLLITEAQTLNQVSASSNENQPKADLHNGYFQNPIFPGDYGDPSIVRVDSDYYMAFSRGDGMIIFHSRDLVNWEPLVRHVLEDSLRKVWAVDLQYFNHQFYLYIPVGAYPGKTESNFKNMVLTAPRAEGPWGKPIDLHVPHHEVSANIDPGFIQTPTGIKYLYTSKGVVISLSPDGKKAIGTQETVYDGWQYPEEWNVECFCLESPKLFYRLGYYYLVSAEGGTVGPSTSHMAVVARSTSPKGPWTNSPYNPIVHTYSQTEKWWSQGHATIFDAVDGSWWIVYHARLKDYPELGRSTLLMPISWTNDGWPVIKNGLSASDILPKPVGENVGNPLRLSDNFRSGKPGMQWSYAHDKKDRYQFREQGLKLQASGTDLTSATTISLRAVNISFEVSIEISNPDSNVTAGIVLGKDGVQTNGVQSTFSGGPEYRLKDAARTVKDKNHVFLKIRNLRKDLSFWWSDDGVNWKNFGKGLRVNESYSVSLFAFGKGSASFKNFRYTGLE